MMSDLHWTGAVLLLAVAALGGSATRMRQATELSWDDFAREHGLAADEPAAAECTATAANAAARPTPPKVGGSGGQTSSHSPSPNVRAAGGPSATVALAPYRPDAPTGRTTWLRATAACGHCGRPAGDLEWDAAAPAKRAVLRPAGGAPTRVVPLGARLRCTHCGGPVFAEEPEPIVVRARVALAPARRGRPRKAAQRAS